MLLERLPETVRTLYSELLDQLIQSEAERLMIPEAGSFVSKEISGRTYWYLQRLEGANRRQIYLGPDSPSLRAWMDSVTEQRRRSRPDDRRRAEIVRMLVSGGATADATPFLQVIQVLADAKIFRVGGMLVGTQAFTALSNFLGVRFPSRFLRTMDVDVAQPPRIEVSLSEELGKIDLLERLRVHEPAFFAVPGLDPDCPSTSFKVRGRDLRVDFLTSGKGEKPVFLPRFGVVALPMTHLDYLMEAPVQVAILGGSGILANVPDPARYALHKLWTTAERPLQEREKSKKDIQQATALLQLLIEEAPDDIRAAWHATAKRSGMRTAIRNASRVMGETGVSLRKLL